MTKLRSYLALFLALLLALLIPLSASAAEIKVDKSVCVIDNANVLDWETEAYLTKITTALDNACGAQIGVYTVDYIGNTTMEDYCYQVASAWGMGDKDKDNGVVLLFAIKEDDYYVTRGTGIENQLSSATLKRILDQKLEPSWVEGDFDRGARETVLSIAQTVASIYGVSLTVDGETYEGGNEFVEEKTPWTWESTLGVFVFLLLILPVILSIFSFCGPLLLIFWAPFELLFELLGGLFERNRPRRGGYGGSYSSGRGYSSHYGGYSPGRSSGTGRSYSSGSSWSSSSSRSSGSSWGSSGGSSFRGSGGGSFRGGGAGRH